MRSWDMLCPLCGQRKARRDCPALGRQICAVCCGTKRQIEIRCPADCAYLLSALAHPPAVVQRQRQRDLTALVPTLQGLTERQSQLFFVIATFLSRHRADALQQPRDPDVAAAAAALAATYETSVRGIIYEHQPAGVPAQRLAHEIRTVLANVGKDAGSAFERDAAAVLRRIEKGAREISAAVAGGEAAYLELLARVVRQAEPASPVREDGDGAPLDSTGPSLILP